MISPRGGSLQPGLLTISFDSDQQLLERLFLLARVLATQPQVLSKPEPPPVAFPLSHATCGNGVFRRDVVEFVAFSDVPETRKSLTRVLATQPQVLSSVSFPP